MKKILRFPLLVLTTLIGQPNWVAPTWLRAINTFCSLYPKCSLVSFLLAVMMVGVYFYVDALPKPVMVVAKLGDIQVTPNKASAKPSDLLIRFEYDLDLLHANQTRPEGQPSVARIDLVGKVIKQGVQLSPVKKGTWMWIDDRQLQFTPETDWSPGTEYTLSFESYAFSEETELSTQHYEFSTSELKVDVSRMEFYQDPNDISIRRVVSTFQFSHPIDKASFEKSLSMGMRPSGKGIEVDLSPESFSVTYDKNYREAYVQTDPITLPVEESYIQLSLAKGVKSIFGGEEIKKTIDKKVVIPSLYSFLKVNNSIFSIIRNEKNEPQQLLMLEFTDEIDKSELMS
jgi:hypothetical protein